MVDSEMGEIPTGWEVKKLKDLGRIVCGKTPPKSKQEYFDGELPFIKIPDMHGQTFVVDTEDSLTDEGRYFQENKTLPPNSVCVSCIATVGLVCINPKNAQTNQQINSIVPNNDNLTPYLYFKMSSMKDFIEILASGGSATLNLNTNNFSNIEIVIPNVYLLQKYHEIVQPLFYKILNNLLENQHLSQIRDSLLPKLMSGEIDVSEVKI
jgi:type I restriction enzyme S subunit